jgi:hypothetical protein
MVADLGCFPLGLLWPCIRETARDAEYFLVQAASSNPEVIALNGNILRPGEQRLLYMDAMKTAVVCGPVPECQVQIWAVRDGV